MSSLREISFEITESRKNGPVPTFYSIWHVLINSNCKSNNPAVIDSCAQSLRGALVYTFDQHKEEAFRVDREGDVFSPETVETIRINYAAEKGEDPRGGATHVHAIVEVKHHTILQVDRKRCNELIREYLKDNPNISNPYVNIKWVPASKTALENYIGKNPLTRAGESFEKSLLHREGGSTRPWGLRGAMEEEEDS